MHVGENLHLHVPGLGDEPFQKYCVISERLEGLPFRRRKRFFEFWRVGRDPHPLAPSASNCLDHDWISQFFRLGFEGWEFLVLAMITVDYRHVGCRHYRLGCAGSEREMCKIKRTFLGLIPFDPHVSDGGRRRADENDVFFLALFCELDVFWQKSVSGMYGLASCLFGNFQDFAWA